MIKKKLYGVFALALCIILLLTLCACEMGTKMTLDSAFSGKRVMSIDVKASDLTAMSGMSLSIITADDITAILTESCPPELTLKTTTSGTITKTTHYEFTLSFTGFEDYVAKVSSLLGYAPNISYTPESDELFRSGITLKEDFSSADLFGWALDAISKEYPRADTDRLLTDAASADTIVNFNGKNYISTGNVDISPVFTGLESVGVETLRYGQTEFSRIVTVNIAADDLAAIGKQALTDEFFLPLTAGIEPLVESSGWDDEDTYAIVMKKGGIDELNAFSSAVFANSSSSYAKGNDVAFAEIGTLSENLDFSAFVCNADGTANVTLSYQSAGGIDFISTNIGTLGEDGMSVAIEQKACRNIQVDLTGESRYELEAVSVGTNVDYGGKTTVTVTLGFPTAVSRSACEHVAAYCTEKFTEAGMNTQIASSTRNSITGELVTSYCVVLLAEGDAETITSVFRKAFGSDSNKLECTSDENFDLFSETDVVHTVDISSFLDEAKYDGYISYVFNSPLTQVRNVQATDGSGTENADVLNGEQKINSFSALVYDGVFTISFRYTRLNYIYLALIIAGAILAFTLIAVIVGTVGKHSYEKRRQRKQASGRDALNMVAIALLPEEKQKELAELNSPLPKELENRPVAVLEPRFDEGLDDDNDEPEGIVLFTSTLRLLSISALVLCFFPFCTVTSNITSTENLSGWNLFYGKTIFKSLLVADSGIEYPGSTLAVLLLVIPVVILCGLALKRRLPKFILPLTVLGGTIFQIVYLMQLPDIIGNTIDSLRGQAITYITDPVFQMGYTYSIVIYILLAIGGIMLLLSDVTALVSDSVNPEKLERRKEARANKNIFGKTK